MRPAVAVVVSSSAVIGLCLFVVAMFHFAPDDLLRFTCYLLVAILASTLKVRLPGMESTMSVHFLFVLLGVLELSQGEAVVLGCSATLVQCLWRPKHRPEFVKVVFNVFGMAAPAIFLTYKAYHAWGPHTARNTPVLLLLMAFTYFVANTFPVSVVIALSTGTSFRRVWSETFFWSLPYYLVGAALVGVVSWIDRYTGWQSAMLAVPLIYWVYRSYQLYLKRLEEEKERVEIEAKRVEAEKRHVEEVCALHLRTIEGLALAIEAKDQNTHSHLHRVRTFAVEIGTELGLGKDLLDALRAAALLHDIGKLAVPDHIINKPGAYTPEEYEKLKIHPVVGAEILERVSFPYPVAPIVRAHHEHWDGTGYPDGLRGEAIPIGARILALVDRLDALTSDQQNRRAVPMEQAMHLLTEESGSKFDPAIVALLGRRWADLEILAERKLDDVSDDALRLTPSAAGADRRADNSPAASPLPAEEPISFLASIASARQEAHTLFELSQDLGNSMSLEEALSLVTSRLRKLIPYDSVAVFVRHEGTLIPEFVAGEHSRLLPTLQLPLGTGLCGRVAEDGQPVLNGDPGLDAGIAEGGGERTSLRSALVVPLEDGTGVVGVMALYHPAADAFTSEHLRILQMITARVASSLENALRYRQAEALATVDHLTELANARALSSHLEQELARCAREGDQLTVMVCDLDGFKEVNDCHGHLAGDRVLKRFAQLLRETCRPDDYLARMGGDEFVIVAPNLPPRAVEACALAFSYLAQQAGTEVCGTNTLSLSLGASYFPNDGFAPETLFAAADKRMYSMKSTHHKARNRPPLRAAHEEPVLPLQ